MTTGENHVNPQDAAKMAQESPESEKKRGGILPWIAGATLLAVGGGILYDNRSDIKDYLCENGLSPLTSWCAEGSNTATVPPVPVPRPSNSSKKPATATVPQVETCDRSKVSDTFTLNDESFDVKQFGPGKKVMGDRVFEGLEGVMGQTTLPKGTILQIKYNGGRFSMTKGNSDSYFFLDENFKEGKKKGDPGCTEQIGNIVQVVVPEEKPSAPAIIKSWNRFDLNTDGFDDRITQTGKGITVNLGRGGGKYAPGMRLSEDQLRAILLSSQNFLPPELEGLLPNGFGELSTYGMVAGERGEMFLEMIAQTEREADRTSFFRINEGNIPAAAYDAANLASRVGVNESIANLEFAFMKSNNRIQTTNSDLEDYVNKLSDKRDLGTIALNWVLGSALYDVTNHDYDSTVVGDADIVFAKYAALSSGTPKVHEALTKANPQKYENALQATRLDAIDKLGAHIASRTFELGGTD